MVKRGLLAGVFVLGISTPSFAAPFMNAAQAGPTTATLTQTDIDVIVAASHYLVTHAFRDRKDPDARFLAIQMEAASGEVKSAMFLPSEFVDKTTTDALVLDLLRRNRMIYLRPREIDVEDVRIVGSKTVDDWFARKVAEKEFPSSKSKGWIYLWLPGYGPDQGEALLYVFDTGSGDYMDMWGALLRLKREGSGWKVVHYKEAWRA